MIQKEFGISTERQESIKSASDPKRTASVWPYASKRGSLARLAALAGTMLCALAQAQEFPALIDLGSLDGIDGFQLDGEMLGDYAGVSVSAAGDINGDLIDDLIVGAYRANPNGVADVGRTYVLFGDDRGFVSGIQFSDLGGSAGFMIDGESANDWLGASVAGAGDFNGDSIDDIIIGAWGADPNGDRSGRSYVVYGSDSGFDFSLMLGNLDGSNGFKLDGAAASDRSGSAVAAAGDINGDGFADVIIGADGQDANGVFESGRSYVVFGDSGAFSPSEQLSAVDGVWGFSISGESSLDTSGYSVGGAGDVNGDGFDDVIVGAFRAPSASLVGRSYVVFGKSGGFEADVSLADLDGSNGFRLDGVDDSEAGFSVSGAGDVNGDRIADLIIGAPGASFNGSSSGSAYVVFGTTAGFPSVLELGSLGGADGFRLDGEASFHMAGSSVDGAGDINGDGLDDLIIGAPTSLDSSSKTGQSYVVFGRSNGFPGVLQLSGLDGTNGFKLAGESGGDSAGISVSAAGDLNGDGRPDLIIGAYGNDANGETDSGRSYVVFGRGTPTAGVDDETQPMLFVDGFEPGI